MSPMPSSPLCFCIIHNYAKIPRPHPWMRGCPGEVVDADWTDPHHVPLGHAHKARGGAVTPEGIQANLFTLAQIGGAYDLLALTIEKDHLSVLTRWRVGSGAPPAIEYVRARDTRNASLDKKSPDR